MNKKVISELVTEYTGDTKKLEISNKKVEKSNKKVEKSNKNLEKSIKNQEKSVDNLEKENKDLNQSNQQLSTSTENLAHDVDRLRSSQDNLNRSKSKTIKDNRVILNQQKQIGNLNKQNDFFSNARSTINDKVGGARAGVLGGLSSLLLGISIMENARYLDPYGKLATKFDITVEELSSLTQVISRAGGSFQNLASGTSSLYGKISRAQVGNNEFSKIFRSLGVDVSNPGTFKDIIYQLSGELQKYSKDEQIGLLRRLEIETLSPLLQLTPQEIKKQIEYQSQYGFLSDKQVRNAESQLDSFDNLRQSLESSKSKIFSSDTFTDYITNLSNTTAKILQGNFEEISEELSNASLGTKATYAISGGILALILAPLAFHISSLVGSLGLFSGGLTAVTTALYLFKDDLFSIIKNFSDKISNVFDFSHRPLTQQEVSASMASPYLRKNPLVQEYLRSQNISYVTATHDQLRMAHKAVTAQSSIGTDPLTNRFIYESLSGFRLNNPESNFNIVNNIEIFTQATSAEDIAGEIGNVLNIELSNTIADFDTGTQ